MTDPTPAQLVNAILQIEGWISAEEKRFDMHIKPHRAKIEELKNKLQNHLNETGGKSFKCEHGTAYLTTITTPSIEGDKTSFLDWCLDDWDHRGAMLQIGAPQKAALQEFIDANAGQPPPQVKLSSITRLNVRRS